MIPVQSPGAAAGWSTTTTDLVLSTALQRSVQAQSLTSAVRYIL